ncbi:unnamed protein product [Adineta steineri]|uniref:Uncharacterized protein n=1 Tax=Adineta steineri TaxID=433720 RepID=A0A815ZXY3_9BILA|nr:unnamed protein product [Adineta steineri]CAF1587983.1 unnamed protein product [Adineta steineri]
MNVSLLFALPSRLFFQTDDSEDYDDMEKRQLSKRVQLATPWVNKRNPALCDYRLQLRPLPLTSALCAYGQTKDDTHQMHPFKYG